MGLAPPEYDGDEGPDEAHQIPFHKARMKAAFDRSRTADLIDGLILASAFVALLWWLL